MVSRVPDETGLKPWQQEVAGGEYFNYSWRGLWLRAVVLGGNEGIVAAAFLVMGVGTFMHDMKPLIIAGLVGIVAGPLSTALAEFASVDTVKAQEDRYKNGERRFSRKSGGPKSDSGGCGGFTGIHDQEFLVKV
ncbi:hypothetical protein LOK49_LG09G00363 [Camellia lanceoleosa]|uniref:Uncharacterized protein n=1 Tax=Camellia lanceoleosa TaxID=1840588 RepID=A0ACC0GMW4_9ERIC|nr:hypothetical protein LOK49_LG09G00363 [Camellia lanceoleosa]